MGLSLSQLPDVHYVDQLAKGHFRIGDFGYLPSLRGDQVSKLYRNWDLAKTRLQNGPTLATFFEFREQILENEEFSFFGDAPYEVLKHLFRVFGNPIYHAAPADGSYHCNSGVDLAEGPGAAAQHESSPATRRGGGRTRGSPEDARASRAPQTNANHKLVEFVYDLPAETLRVDVLEMLSVLILVSRAMSRLSKTRFLFSLFDFGRNGELTFAEFVIMVRTILRGLLRVAQRTRIYHEWLLKDVLNESSLKDHENKADVVGNAFSQDASSMVIAQSGREARASEIDPSGVERSPRRGRKVTNSDVKRLLQPKSVWVAEQESQMKGISSTDQKSPPKLRERTSNSPAKTMLVSPAQDPHVKKYFFPQKSDEVYLHAQIYHIDWLLREELFAFYQHEKDENTALAAELPQMRNNPPGEVDQDVLAPRPPTGVVPARIFGAWTVRNGTVGRLLDMFDLPEEVQRLGPVPARVAVEIEVVLDIWAALKIANMDGAGMLADHAVGEHRRKRRKYADRYEESLHFHVDCVSSKPKPPKKWERWEQYEKELGLHREEVERLAKLEAERLAAAEAEEESLAAMDDHLMQDKPHIDAMTQDVEDGGGRSASAGAGGGGRSVEIMEGQHTAPATLDHLQRKADEVKRNLVTARKEESEEKGNNSSSSETERRTLQAVAAASRPLASFQGEKVRKDETSGQWQYVEKHESSEEELEVMPYELSRVFTREDDGDLMSGPARQQLVDLLQARAPIAHTSSEEEVEAMVRRASLKFERRFGAVSGEQDGAGAGGAKERREDVEGEGGVPSAEWASHSLGEREQQYLQEQRHAAHEPRLKEKRRSKTSVLLDQYTAEKVQKMDRELKQKLAVLREDPKRKPKRSRYRLSVDLAHIDCMKVVERHGESLDKYFLYAHWKSLVRGPAFYAHLEKMFELERRDWTLPPLVRVFFPQLNLLSLERHVEIAMEMQGVRLREIERIEQEKLQKLLEETERTKDSWIPPSKTSKSDEPSDEAEAAKMNLFDKNDPYFKENPLAAIRSRVGLSLMERVNAILEQFFGGDEETDLLKRADEAKERNRFALIDRFKGAQQRKGKRDKDIDDRHQESKRRMKEWRESMDEKGKNWDAVEKRVDIQIEAKHRMPEVDEALAIYKLPVVKMVEEMMARKYNSLEIVAHQLVGLIDEENVNAKLLDEDEDAILDVAEGGDLTKYRRGGEKEDLARKKKEEELALRQEMRRKSFDRSRQASNERVSAMLAAGAKDVRNIEASVDFADKLLSQYHECGGRATGVEVDMVKAREAIEMNRRTGGSVVSEAELKPWRQKKKEEDEATAILASGTKKEQDEKMRMKEEFMAKMEAEKAAIREERERIKQEKATLKKQTEESAFSMLEIVRAPEGMSVAPGSDRIKPSEVFLKTHALTVAERGVREIGGEDEDAEVDAEDDIISRGQPVGTTGSSIVTQERTQSKQELRRYTLDIDGVRGSSARGALGSGDRGRGEEEDDDEEGAVRFGVVEAQEFVENKTKKTRWYAEDTDYESAAMKPGKMPRERSSHRRSRSGGSEGQEQTPNHAGVLLHGEFVATELEEDESQERAPADPDAESAPPVEGRSASKLPTQGVERKASTIGGALKVDLARRKLKRRTSRGNSKEATGSKPASRSVSKEAGGRGVEDADQAAEEVGGQTAVAGETQDEEDDGENKQGGRGGDGDHNYSTPRGRTAFVELEQRHDAADPNDAPQPKKKLSKKKRREEERLRKAEEERLRQEQEEATRLILGANIISIIEDTKVRNKNIQAALDNALTYKIHDFSFEPFVLAEGEKSWVSELRHLHEASRRFHIMDQLSRGKERMKKLSPRGSAVGSSPGGSVDGRADDLEQKSPAKGSYEAAAGEVETTTVVAVDEEGGTTALYARAQGEPTSAVAKLARVDELVAGMSLPGAKDESAAALVPTEADLQIAAAFQDKLQIEEAARIERERLAEEERVRLLAEEEERANQEEDELLKITADEIQSEIPFVADAPTEDAEVEVGSKKSGRSGSSSPSAKSKAGDKSKTNNKLAELDAAGQLPDTPEKQRSEQEQKDVSYAVTKILERVHRRVVEKFEQQIAAASLIAQKVTRAKRAAKKMKARMKELYEADQADIPSSGHADIPYSEKIPTLVGSSQEASSTAMSSVSEVDEPLFGERRARRELRKQRGEEVLSASSEQGDEEGEADRRSEGGSSSSGSGSTSSSSGESSELEFAASATHLRRKARKKRKRGKDDDPESPRTVLAHDPLYLGVLLRESQAPFYSEASTPDMGMRSPRIPGDLMAAAASEVLRFAGQWTVAKIQGNDFLRRKLLHADIVNDVRSERKKRDDDKLQKEKNLNDSNFMAGQAAKVLGEEEIPDQQAEENKRLQKQKELMAKFSVGVPADSVIPSPGSLSSKNISASDASDKARKKQLQSERELLWANADVKMLVAQIVGKAQSTVAFKLKEDQKLSRKKWVDKWMAKHREKFEFLRGMVAKECDMGGGGGSGGGGRERNDNEDAEVDDGGVPKCRNKAEHWDE
eukprot:g634.t1